MLTLLHERRTHASPEIKSVLSQAQIKQQTSPYNSKAQSVEDNFHHAVGNFNKSPKVIIDKLSGRITIKDDKILSLLNKWIYAFLHWS